MCVILRLTCATADCKSPGIDGEEECHFGDTPRNRIECDHGHQILYCGQGLLGDLHAKAEAAGWHCDGTRWFCADCVKRDYLAYMQPFINEAIAHSMNV